MKRLAACCGVIAAVGLAGCSPEPEPDHGADATACAELVGVYLGLHQAVEVTDAERSEGRPQVRIDYRSMNDMNVPVEGLALCRFETNTAPFRVTDAFVDDNRLAADEIAAFNDSR